MQSELPWNVAGIPPEAREAARAAARREGLSVGEWMTRRIMRGFPDASPEDRGAWRPSLVEPPPVQPYVAQFSRDDVAHSLRDSEEMLARVSRSEAEAQNAYSTLDQQLKTVSRRLETAERNQSENNRAMTQAATQINIAAREQAQAFEQLTANLAGLAERLSRVERQAQTDSTREAVKALHEGLSRVADQIGQTANQSASQIAALAGNVDLLATQLAETRQATEATAQATEATAHAVEARFGSFDERLRVVERTAFSGASALDHTMENVETLRAAKETVEAEQRQQAAALAHLRDSFEQFSAHSSIDESARASAIGCLEERLADLQAQHSENPLDRRLDGIEHLLSEITARLEQAERANTATGGTVEQTLRELALGFETADRHNRDTIRELQSAMQENATKIAAVEQKLTAQPAQPIFDMPQFPDQAPPLPEAALDYPASLDAADAFASNSNPDPFLAPPPLAEAAAPEFGEPFRSESPQTIAGESFLAAARRSANDAATKAAETPPRGRTGNLGWSFAGKSKARQSTSQPKGYLMAGSVFGVAVAAALGGVVLSRGVGSTQPHSAPTATISSPLGARPVIAPPKGLQQNHQEPAADASAEAGSAPQPGSTPAQGTVTPATPKLSRLDALPPKPASETAEPSARLTTASVERAPSASGLQPRGDSGSPGQRLLVLARSGDPKSQLQLGLRYLEGNGVAVNEAEAARWLARAAQQGEPLAQYRLGTLYERGRGVAADPKQASHWYELAAKQGNRKAMHNLAVSFAEGSGEPKDPAQAAIWFSRAANLGLADSQFNLAVLYERGMGVKQSLADAYKWYLIAAAQGDGESKTRAEALATQLSDADRTAAQQAASAFRPQPLNPTANGPSVSG